MGFRDDNSSLGHFLYPPNDNSLYFNYRDTVNVSWTTFDASPLGFLSLWYWTGSGAWQLSLNKSVPLNGSYTADLAVTSAGYSGQFNINFASDDGSDGKYLSEFFNVDHNSSQAPLAWPAASTSQVPPKPENSTTTVSAPLSSQPSSSLSSHPTSSPPSQPDPTPSSATHTSSMTGGAIAGISVGSILGSGILVLAVLFFIRRSRRNRRSQSGRFTPSGPVTELPGRNEEWRELSTEGSIVRELPAAESYLARSELPTHRAG